MKFEDLVGLNSFLELQNKIIASAIIYGGDSGGPYLIEDEDLLISLKRLCNLLNSKNKKLLGDSMKIVIITMEEIYQLGIEKTI